MSTQCVMRWAAIGFGLLVCVNHARAAEDSSPVMQAIPLSEDMDLSPLKGKGVEVLSYGKAEKDQDPPSETPTPKVRDQLIREAHLEDEARGFDHLDRDLLFLRARDLSADDLRAKYPKFPATKLAKFQRSVRESLGGH